MIVDPERENKLRQMEEKLMSI